MVAGSGATEQHDEPAIIAVDQVQPHSVDDGYQTGVPGPLTRLFVIANRGVANLIQDLILVCVFKVNVSNNANLNILNNRF